MQQCEKVNRTISFYYLHAPPKTKKSVFFLPWEGKTLVGTTDRKGPVVSR